MQRRTILKVLSGGLAAVSASLIAIPGAGFIVELTRRRKAHGVVVQRVARLSDLVPNKPILVPVVGVRKDAWTIYPSETIGRVWIVRRDAASDSESEADAKVDALASICPHLGCQIQLDSSQEHFVCPCHKAAFAKSGEPMTHEQLGRRNQTPRAMDSLECHLVQDEKSGEWWVEVKYEEFEEGLTKKVAKA